MYSDLFSNRTSNLDPYTVEDSPVSELYSIKYPNFTMFRIFPVCHTFKIIFLHPYIPSRTQQLGKRELLRLPTLHGRIELLATQLQECGIHFLRFSVIQIHFYHLNPRWKPIPSCYSTMFKPNTLIYLCTFVVFHLSIYVHFLLMLSLY